MAKILLIDDDVQVLEVMTSFLEREHHEVSTAVDGKQGIRLHEGQQFDLIITDVFIKLHANKVLHKPVDFETLTSAIREVLKGVAE